MMYLMFWLLIAMQNVVAETQQSFILFWNTVKFGLGLEGTISLPHMMSGVSVGVTQASEGLNEPS